MESGGFKREQELFVTIKETFLVVRESKEQSEPISGTKQALIVSILYKSHMLRRIALQPLRPLILEQFRPGKGRLTVQFHGTFKINH